VPRTDMTLACIGGSFTHQLLSTGKLEGERLGPRATPFGESQAIYHCPTERGPFYLLLRHSDGPDPVASSFVNHRANVYALKELGTTHIIAWSAARAISHNYGIGRFAIVGDLIDETRQRAGTFFERGNFGDLRQWPLFCPVLRNAAARALDEMGIKFLEGGTYVCSEGPRRETRAEVRKFAIWGADLLGHSLAPEVFLARELQICYAGLCFVADFAETGSDHRPFEAGYLFDDLGPKDDRKRRKEALDQLPEILTNMLAILPTIDAKCSCNSNLRKVVGDELADKDFRTWFKTLRHAPSPPTVSTATADKRR